MPENLPPPEQSQPWHYLSDTIKETDLSAFISGGQVKDIYGLWRLTGNLFSSVYNHYDGHWFGIQRDINTASKEELTPQQRILLGHIRAEFNYQVAYTAAYLANTQEVSAQEKSLQEPFLLQLPLEKVYQMAQDFKAKYGRDIIEENPSITDTDEIYLVRLKGIQDVILQQEQELLDRSIYDLMMATGKIPGPEEILPQELKRAAVISILPPPPPITIPKPITLPALPPTSTPEPPSLPPEKIGNDLYQAGMDLLAEIREIPYNNIIAIQNLFPINSPKRNNALGIVFRSLSPANGTEEMRVTKIQLEQYRKDMLRLQRALIMSEFNGNPPACVRDALSLNKIYELWALDAGGEDSTRAILDLDPEYRQKVSQTANQIVLPSFIEHHHDSGWKKINPLIANHFRDVATIVSGTLANLQTHN